MNLGSLLLHGTMTLEVEQIFGLSRTELLDKLLSFLSVIFFFFWGGGGAISLHYLFFISFKGFDLTHPSNPMFKQV